MKREIHVCDAWVDSFESFYKDLGKRPSPKHSIERIDNDLGYQPGNCKWATNFEQARNKTTSHMIEFNGETLCITDWARKLKMNHGTLVRRLQRGWTVEESFELKARGR
jgi:hypothetical protein